MQVTTRSAEMKELREAMQQDINAVSKIADTIKKRLQDLDKANEQALKRKVRPPALRDRVCAEANGFLAAG